MSKQYFAIFSAVFAVLAACAADNTYTGTAGGDWDTDTNWSRGTKPTADDDVIIAKAVAATGANALAAKSLTINNGGTLIVGALGMTDIHPSVAVAQNFTLNGNATFTIYAGPTNDTYTLATGGARVTVGGTTTLNDTSSIRPWAHATSATAFTSPLCTGAPVVFDLHTFVLSAGASVDASGKGFTRYAICPARCDKLNLQTGAYWGGSHGGSGGRLTTGDTPTPAYDYLLAPLLPGYAGGNGPQGGGTIRIIATSATLNGTLNAAGTDGGSSGAAGGGSIWLTCDALTVGSSAVINARGGNVGAQAYGVNSGSGGGGRVSFGIGLTAAQLEALYATGEAPGLATNDLAQVFPGQVDVSAGYIRALGVNLHNKGGAGSAVYIVDATGKVGFSVENEPSFAATVSPALGIHALATGAMVSGSATSPALVPGTATSRRVCTGYEIRDDATGTVLASGAAASFSDFEMPSQPVTLVWKWATLENKLTVSAPANGAVDAAEAWVVSTGDYPTVTATASDGYEFQYWTGDVDYADRFSNPLILKADRPRTVKAFFGRISGGAYTMHRTSNTTVWNWHDAANWTPNGIPGTNDAATVVWSSGTYRLVQVDTFARVKTLGLSGACAYLRIGSTAATTSKDIAAHTPFTSSSSVGLDVTGDFSITNGAWAAIGGDCIEYAADLNVGGNLLVGGNAAKLGVAAASTNHVSASLYDATSTVRVGGKLTVADSGTIYPDAHYMTGGSVAFIAGEVEVQAGGQFNASDLGYRQYSVNSEYVFPWPGAFDNRLNKYVGGAHAGRGGNNANDSWVGNVYGCSNAPVHPGADGGNTTLRAAGVIRISADTVTLAGALVAKGHDGATYGGAAGGSVQVIAHASFSATADALINVDGGSITRNNSGGGGGGRAAIAVKLTPEQLVAVRDSDAVADVKYSPLADIVPGFTTAGGATGGYTSCTAGEAGTGVYLLNTTGAAPLNISGDPELTGVVSPSYGMTSQSTGATIVVSAPAFAYVAGTDERSRRLCGGFVVTNATAGTVTASASTSGAFTMPEEESWLIWNWTALEHKLVLTADGGGRIVTNSIGKAGADWQSAGSAVSLTAVPDEGYVFAGWFGRIRGIDRTQVNLSFTMTEAHELRAYFATTAGGAKTWNGGTGDWTESGKWSPPGIPGPFDDTYVNGGTVTIDTGFPVPARSLTVGKGASVIMRDSAGYPDNFVGLALSGSLVLNGTMTIGAQGQKATSELAIGGDLMVTNGTSSTLTIYAGYRGHPELAETYRLGGGTVNVGGTLLIGSNALVRPVCEGVSGAPVCFTARKVRVENGGAINASGAGYTWTLVSGQRVGYAPGSPPNSRLSDYDGGSYGGLGAPNDSWNGGSALCTSTYGVDFAPYMPGSPGGNQGTGGGGAIRIDCTAAEIFGTLNANGEDGGSYGGNSGGAIWLACRRLTTSATAVFSAKGGIPGTWGASGDKARSGGGGGGRICIMEGAQPELVAALYTAETRPASIARHDLTTAGGQAATPVSGTVDVDGGARPEYPYNDGHIGTAVYLAAPPPAMILILR